MVDIIVKFAIKIRSPDDKATAEVNGNTSERQANEKKNSKGLEERGMLTNQFITERQGFFFFFLMRVLYTCTYTFEFGAHQKWMKIRLREERWWISFLKIYDFTAPSSDKAWSTKNILYICIIQSQVFADWEVFYD